MKFIYMQRLAVVSFFSMLVCIANATDLAPKLGKLWLETQISNPEGTGQTGRQLSPLSGQAYKYSDGHYQSISSRITISIPMIRSESLVSVRESVISRRPNGIPITSHVLFIPGGVGAAPTTTDGASAIVVTLLRQDRSKDAASVLSQFEPPNESVRNSLVLQGVDYSKVSTNMGEALQRVVRNRLADDPFPYVMRVKPTGGLLSFGVSRYVVAPNDSLIEFSQVFPCNDMAEADCRSQAILKMQGFMSGVREFLVLPDELKQ